MKKNGKNIGKKTQISNQKLDRSKKNFIVLKCFLIHQEEFIWDMSEITQLRCLARYKKLNGFSFASYGLDSLVRLPAENAAKQNKLDPKWTEKNIQL